MVHLGKAARLGRVTDRSAALVLPRPMSVIVDKRKEIVSADTEGKFDSRPVRWAHRIRDFPRNINKLWHDCLRYRAIHDAAQTSNNAWRGRVPRRQHEQQRKLVQDMRIVLPTVLLWIPPIIGYIPMFLAVLAPRQTLSRQFHNPYEKHHFSYIEYSQRKLSYGFLSSQFWGALSTTPGELNLSVEKTDIAGPVFDLTSLFHLFCGCKSLSELDLYTKKHLVTLALASGYCQRFPVPISDWFTRMVPSRGLAYELSQMAQTVAEDDELLIEEGYHLGGCVNLTDQEVVEATLQRGMPVTGSHENMRVALTNHLVMIENLASSVDITSSKDAEKNFQLFTLYLPSIRCSLLKK